MDMECTTSGENGDQQFAEDPSNANFEQPGDIVPAAGNVPGDGHEGEKINASKNDDDERKIFVGGVSWETTVKDMKEYFSKFGEVLDCTLKTDPSTGRSRGFGFVLFGSRDSVDKVVMHNEGHVLQGKQIDPKRANPLGNREPIKKVFVGGLDPEIPEDEIRSHFGQYGKIEEIDLPYDKAKGQRRAFCFITFESEEVVDRCCEKAKQAIGNTSKDVDVKKATPKDQQGYWQGGRGRGWGGGPQRGGRGRGRGNYNQGWGSGGYGYDSYDYYNQGYGGYDYGNNYYGGYDYNNYYNQGWGYNQGYGGGYGSYGGYGNNSYGGGSGNQDGSYSKPKRGGTSVSTTGASGYHPYSR